MGIRQIITSDYDGKPLGDNTQPTVITIKTPGQTAKDAESFEVYLSDDDIDQLLDSLRSPEKQIIPKSLPKATAPAGTRKTSGNSELDQFKSVLFKNLNLTSQAAKSQEQQWFKKRWTNASEAKPELVELIVQASDEDLKRVAQLKPGDKDDLVAVLNSGKSTINSGVLKVARLLKDEEVPS
jgi:hypothetical protein